MQTVIYLPNILGSKNSKASGLPTGILFGLGSISPLVGISSKASSN